MRFRLCLAVLPGLLSILVRADNGSVVDYSGMERRAEQAMEKTLKLGKRGSSAARHASGTTAPLFRALVFKDHAKACLGQIRMSNNTERVGKPVRR